MLMGNTAAAAAFVLMVGACGCPYESSTPLGQPGSVDVDPALLGEWACHDPGATPPEATLKIFRFDASQYVVEISAAGEDSPGRSRAYGTRAGTSVLLNVRELTLSSLPPAPDRPAEPRWAFARYRIDPAGRLEVRMVCEDSLKNLSEKDALDAILARASDEALYGEALVCTRSRGREQ